MRVALIAKSGHAHTGVGRFARMLGAELRTAGFDITWANPAVPPLPAAACGLLHRLGMDLQAFLHNYPVWTAYPRADVYHFTSQNLASALLFRRPRGRVVVTVHDIIPYVLRDDARLSPYRTPADRLFDRLSLLGLRRADCLIAPSEYTRQCLVRYLGIRPEKIAVVYMAVEHERFRPLPVPESLRARYNLPVGPRYLIYVGSEDPRKNLPALVQALSEVRRALPDVELIKVGRAQFRQERRRLERLAEELALRPAVHFLDDVPDEDLPLLYNLAAVCVMPSLYEGFGLPVLEAMACGTPLVCANATALPEVAGGAAVLVDCANGATAGLAAGIRALLTDDEERRRLSLQGIARAARFRWSDTAGQIAAFYGLPPGGTSGAQAQFAGVPARRS